MSPRRESPWSKCAIWSIFAQAREIFAQAREILTQAKLFSLTRKKKKTSFGLSILIV